MSCCGGCRKLFHSPAKDSTANWSTVLDTLDTMIYDWDCYVKCHYRITLRRVKTIHFSCNGFGNDIVVFSLYPLLNNEILWVKNNLPQCVDINDSWMWIISRIAIENAYDDWLGIVETKTKNCLRLEEFIHTHFLFKFNSFITDNVVQRKWHLRFVDCNTYLIKWNTLLK